VAAEFVVILWSWAFWVSFLAVAYAYAGYPLAIGMLARLRARRVDPKAGLVDDLGVSMIIPVHNERSIIRQKLINTKQLEYQPGLLQILFVSDGSTDGTDAIIEESQDDRISLLLLPVRGGKAGALNEGLAHARHPIVVFSDASILLATDAIQQIVRPFSDPAVGCVSGEDHVPAGGGEGLYGRYELFLRRQESLLHSIVGASGSFYAQRREICEPFPPGLAPDFLSVLRTVERGYRAVSWPEARGEMTALASVSDEFSRKVRTILRGLTTLVHHRRLLNPFTHGIFAFELVSHKVARWLVPVFLLSLFVSSAVLALQSWWYSGALLIQVLFYGLALVPFVGGSAVGDWLPVRISVYFTAVNVATLSALFKYLGGARQEIWSPSRR
jgi:cellulose synthase/poly-beta-1,6-N-acetylglucosamine synthase-like glycosyltransferase